MLTGAVGVFSKFVGPITIVPLLILLTMSTVPTLDEKLSLHWISIVSVIFDLSFFDYIHSTYLKFFGLASFECASQGSHITNASYRFGAWRKSGSKIIMKNKKIIVLAG